MALDLLQKGKGIWHTLRGRIRRRTHTVSTPTAFERAAHTPLCESLEPRVLLSASLASPITDVNLPSNATPIVVDLYDSFNDNIDGTVVRFDTVLGEFDVGCVQGLAAGARCNHNRGCHREACRCRLHVAAPVQRLGQAVLLGATQLFRRGEHLFHRGSALKVGFSAARPATRAATAKAIARSQ